MASAFGAAATSAGEAMGDSVWSGQIGEPTLYRLVERFPDGRCMIEEFMAPHDAEALERARDVAESDTIELWSGERRVPI